MAFRLQKIDANLQTKVLVKFCTNGQNITLADSNWFYFLLTAGNNTATQEYVEPVSPTTALPLPLPTDVQIKSQRHFYRRRSAWGAIKSKTVFPFWNGISTGLKCERELYCCVRNRKKS